MFLMKNENEEINQIDFGRLDVVAPICGNEKLYFASGNLMKEFLALRVT